MHESSNQELALALFTITFVYITRLASKSYNTWTKSALQHLSKQHHGEQGRTAQSLAVVDNHRGMRKVTIKRGWCGYQGEGAKTVIASKAFAKISMRLVPHQNSDKITELFKNYFESIAPKSVKVKVTPHHGGEPVVTPSNSVAYKAASMAMETTFGKKPVPTRSGGSIPIVAMFKSELGLDSVLLGFGLDSDAIHSPNEHFGVFNYLKGIETIPYFYKNFAEMSK